MNKEQKPNPYQFVISLFSGKWKLSILYHLGSNEYLRYGELKKSLEGITHKMLSKQLKELESDGLIIRKEYPQIPPKVEYSLSNKAKTLMPLLMNICIWGDQNRD